MLLHGAAMREGGRYGREKILGLQDNGSHPSVLMSARHGWSDTSRLSRQRRWSVVLDYSTALGDLKDNGQLAYFKRLPTPHR